MTLILTYVIKISEWPPTDFSRCSSFIKKLWTKKIRKYFENNILFLLYISYLRNHSRLNFCRKSHKMCWRSFRVMTLTTLIHLSPCPLQRNTLYVDWDWFYIADFTLNTLITPFSPNKKITRHNYQSSVKIRKA